MKHIEQKLDNWGRWMCVRQDGGLGVGQSPLARMGGAAASASADAHCIIPIDELEASKTDDAIRSLPPRLQKVAKLWWADNLTNEQIRRAMGMGSTTTVRSARESVVWGVSMYFDNQAQVRQLAKMRGLHKNHFGM